MSGIDKPNFFNNKDGSASVIPIDDIFSSMSKFQTNQPTAIINNESKILTPSFGFGSTKKKSKKTSFVIDSVTSLPQQEEKITIDSQIVYKTPLIQSKIEYTDDDKYFFRDTQIISAQNIDRIIEENNAREQIGDLFGVEVSTIAIPKSAVKEKKEIGSLIDSLVGKTIVEKKLRDNKSTTYLFSDFVRDLIVIMRRFTEEDRGELINKMIFDCILPKSKMENSSSDPARKQFPSIIAKINLVKESPNIGIKNRDNIDRIVDFLTKSNNTKSYRFDLTPSAGIRNIVLFLEAIIADKMEVRFPVNFRYTTASNSILSLLSKPNLNDLETFYKKKEKVETKVKSASKKTIYDDDFIEGDYDDDRYHR